MSYNGSGTFVINSAGQPVVTGTVISSTAFNALTADLATGLSTALTKDGQTTPTANLPMGTFKFTGLSAGSAATDSANIAQVQNSFGSFLTVSGTDTITATVSPALTAYASGQMFAFVAANTNTGAVTINISSLGAKAITKNGNTALSAGDLTANYLFVVVYDGTQFQVVGVSATTFANLTISGVLTLSGAGVQLTSSGTGAWKLPVGTTAQRPTGASGLIRQNSTTGNPEWYDTTSSSWLQFSQPAGYSVSYLVVAGGGGGGGNQGGGGGAGGLLASSATLSSGVSYSITVGAGGAGDSSAGAAGGTNGTNWYLQALQQQQAVAVVVRVRQTEMVLLVVLVVVVQALLLLVDQELQDKVLLVEMVQLLQLGVVAALLLRVLLAQRVEQVVLVAQELLVVLAGVVLHMLAAAVAVRAAQVLVLAEQVVAVRVQVRQVVQELLLLLILEAVVVAVRLLMELVVQAVQAL